MGKNPLISGITSTETFCAVEFGGNVMISTSNNLINNQKLLGTLLR